MNNIELSLRGRSSWTLFAKRWRELFVRSGETESLSDINKWSINVICSLSRPRSVDINVKSEIRKLMNILLKFILGGVS